MEICKESSQTIFQVILGPTVSYSLQELRQFVINLKQFPLPFSFLTKMAWKHSFCTVFVSFCN